MRSSTKFTLISICCIFTHGFVLCPLIDAMTTPPLIALQGCMKDGKFYKEGASFQPTPCEHCYCNGGRVMCAIADCFITPCVDPVHDPTKCCAQCPNGPNCYAGDKIIPAGKSVQINDHTTCQCPTRFGFGMTAHRAVCAVKLDTVTTHHVVN